MTKEIPYSGGSFQFEVKTESSFSIAVDNPFVRVEPMNGEGTTTITCNVRNNEDTTQRAANIVITLTDEKCAEFEVTNTLSILQFGKEEEVEPVKQYTLTINSNYNGNAIANGIMQPLIQKGENLYSSTFTFNEGTQVSYTRSRLQQQVPKVTTIGLNTNVSELKWYGNATSSDTKNVVVSAAIVTGEYSTFDNPSSGSVTMNSNQSVNVNINAEVHPEQTDSTSMLDSIKFSLAHPLIGFKVTHLERGIFRVSPPNTAPMGVDITDTLMFYLTDFHSVSVNLNKTAKIPTPPLVG